ncbi:MAG: methyltransferase domain-containing protein [Puniceicoccales bacterium]|jgi:tRNA (guanine-N7-)-methyltransferase|nr:methyltransferase domain-containing protein [Puniceicoccales bacterium]
MFADWKTALADIRAARVATMRAHLDAALANGIGDGTGAVTLEIGCGHGHFLTAYAAAHPDKQCIGVDLLANRIERANRKRGRAALSNLVYAKGEASELLDALPQSARLVEIFFLFPDPWPKKRHHKNRFIQTAMLDRLAALSVPDVTRLYFRTDHAGYFSWTAALVGQHPAWRVLDGTDWPFEHETMFSLRAAGSYQSLIAQRRSAA